MQRICGYAAARIRLTLVPEAALRRFAARITPALTVNAVRVILYRTCLERLNGSDVIKQDGENGKTFLLYAQ